MYIELVDCIKSNIVKYPSLGEIKIYALKNFKSNVSSTFILNGISKHKNEIF